MYVLDLRKFRKAALHGPPCERRTISIIRGCSLTVLRSVSDFFSKPHLDRKPDWKDLPHDLCFRASSGGSLNL
jgi:hypothetical protein